MSPAGRRPTPTLPSEPQQVLTRACFSQQTPALDVRGQVLMFLINSWPRAPTPCISTGSSMFHQLKG